MNKAYELAKAEVGTVEWAEGSNPKVVAYFKNSGNAGIKDDETAWCAAFVGAMLKRAGMKGTGLLTARSYLKWGMEVDRKDAREGDIVIFKRGNSSWQGHVAFFVKDNGGTITVLGGNQANAVNRRAYSASSLLGIRRPETAKLNQPQVTVGKPDRKAVVIATSPARKPETVDMTPPPPRLSFWAEVAKLIREIIRRFK